jgi:hypothetical protein
MTLEEEVLALRAYKNNHEGKALNRAFARLEQMLNMAQYDPVMSVRGFRILAECLICIREELNNNRG